MGVYNSFMIFINLIVNWQSSAWDANIFSEFVLCVWRGASTRIVVLSGYLV